MKFYKGVTLVGSLVAITILTISLVSIFNLQVSIIKGKDSLKNNNTANLLASEGIEIVRAIFIKKGSILTVGTYQVDYTSTDLSETSRSQCTDNSIGITCDLDLPTSSNGYQLSNTNSNKIFYRFITIEVIGSSTKRVTSTVIVKNPRGGPSKVYKAYADLYTY